jgi:hypothetical protein
VLLLLVLGACLFCAGLGRLPLIEPDEGRNAEVAREMLVSGDWITPHFDTITYLDKPAVFFSLVAASFKVWGVSEWAARLPSALMALATVFLTWFLAREMFVNSLGLEAGIIFATCPLVLAFSRLVIFDMTLTFLIVLSMGSYWLAETAGFQNPWHDVVMFASMGIATITKGPVGFIIPLLSIAGYAAVRGKIRDLKQLRWWLGTAVFLAATLPWFIAVSLRNPDFPRYALWQESLRRFAAGKVNREGGPFYYVPVFLAGFFPWSLFLLFAGWNRLKRWRELKLDTNRQIVFLLTWVIVVFIFFSLSHSKLPGYALPAFIPLSILMAQCWRQVAPETEARTPDWLTAGFAALLGLGLLLALASQPWILAAKKGQLAKHLHPETMALIRPSLLYSGLILVALAIVGRNLASRARGRFLSAATFALLASTVPLLVVRWLGPITSFANFKSSRILAETILSSPEKDLPIYGYYYFRTSLPFYLRRPVGLVTTDADELTSNYLAARWPAIRRERQTAQASVASKKETQETHSAAVPQGDGLVVTVLEFAPRVWSSSQPFLALTRNSQVWELAYTMRQIEPMWNQWDYSVWEIPPGRPTNNKVPAPRIVTPFHPGP